MPHRTRRRRRLAPGTSPGPLLNPSDVVVRPERAADRAAIAQVVRAAFESEVEPRLVEAIRDSENYVAGYSLVAEMDGRVVGHVMLSWVSLVEGSVEHRVLSLSPLAVLPELQRQGIGERLVREAVSRATADRAPMVILEGSPAYYGRLGFENSAPHGIRFELPDWAPPEAGQLIRLPAYDPSIRGEVRYPAAFAEAEADR